MKTAKRILKTQSNVKVVLNGGKMELDDATIPFQIAFNEKIAKKKPTHILVMDVTESCFDSEMNRSDTDDKSERTLFKLEPIHYLQLKKPGIHNLIFILFFGLDKDDCRRLLKKGRINYEHDIYFDSIEDNDAFFGQVGYVEAIVDVPKELFAEKPEQGIKKLIWQWTNSWYDYSPVDECEYRKRKIWAFTLKPILWLLGLIPRIIIAPLLTMIWFLFRMIGFFFGYQPVSFFANKKELWLDFLFLYPHNHDYEFILLSKNWWGKIIREEKEKIRAIDFYPYKTIAIGKKRFYLPIAIWELVFYFYFFWLYFFCLSHYFSDNALSFWDSIGYLGACVVISFFLSFFLVDTIASLKKDKNWKMKWKYEEKDEKTERAKKAKKLSQNVQFCTFVVMSGIALVSFIIAQINSSQIFSYVHLVSFEIILWGLLAVIVITMIFFFKRKIKLVLSKLGGNIKISHRNIKTIRERKVEEKKNEYQTWLANSFNIASLPKKVDINKMPETSTVVHKFRVRFWWVKAKVCRPFPK